MSNPKLVGALFGATLLISAHAQSPDAASAASDVRGGTPRIKKDVTVELRLPDDLPAAASADAMTGYLVPELSDRQTFAFDPASVRLTGDVVMLTVTATSKTGAKTSGYYAVNCANAEYRLLGFPSGDQWKASSRTRWRRVVDVKRSAVQLVPLLTASCKDADLVVSNATELTNRLQELSDRTN